MKAFHIWSEGYDTTGQSAPAMRHGVADGASFKDACIHFFGGLPKSKQYFDADRMTYWGCRLFDNEAEARKSFG